MAQSKEMTSGPCLPLIFNFTLPLLLGNMLQQTYSLIDAAIVGKCLGINALASVGASTSVVFLILGFCNGCCGGFGIPVAQKFGARDYVSMRRLVSVSLKLAGMMSVGIALITCLLCAFILRTMQTPENIFQDAYWYLLITFIGVPCTFFYNLLSSIIRALGDSKTPFWFLLFSTILNVLLDLLCILVFHWGVAGAAIATVIGNICTDLFFLWFLLKRSRRLSVDPRGFHIQKGELGQIFAIGIPASVTNLMQSLGMALTNRFLLPYGNDAVAAMGIVMKVNLIAVLVLVGLAFGVQPLIGYNYGAKNSRRLRDILKFSYGFECGTAAVLALLLSVAAPALIKIFMQDPGIIELGVPMLRFQQAGMIFIAVVLVTTSTFQSAGKALGAFLLSVSRQGVIFAIVIFLASKTFGYNGVLASQAVSDCLTAILAAVLLFRWIHKEKGSVF